MFSASRSQNLNTSWQWFASCLLAIPLCTWALTSCSLAATIVDSAGFETGFSPGVLQGQVGWVTSGGGAGSASVQGTVFEPGSGSQAVQVNRGALSDDRWAVPVAGSGFPGHRYILVDWDMNVTATGAAPGVFGPFLGVETYDFSTGPNVLGTLGVDATTGDVLFQDPDRGGGLFETGASVTFGQWHHFQIKLDFALDQYQVLLDDFALVTTDFVDGPTDTFTDADISALAAAFDAISQNQIATAYFDNFLVRDVSPADFDIDGDVDGVDLATWQGAFGTTLAADADLDGDSDGADFLIWQRDFDNGVSPLTSPASAVPEPSSLVLALLTFSLYSRTSRRR